MYGGPEVQNSMTKQKAQHKSQGTITNFCQKRLEQTVDKNRCLLVKQTVHLFLNLFFSAGNRKAGLFKLKKKRQCMLIIYFLLF